VLLIIINTFGGKKKKIGMVKKNNLKKIENVLPTKKHSKKNCKFEPIPNSPYTNGL